MPGAFLAALAAMFPWHWFLMLINNFWLIKLVGVENVEYLGYGFFTPLILISVAARIAPKLKRATAVSFSLLVVLLWGWFWLLAGDYYAGLGEKIDALPSLLAMFLNAVAIWVAWKYARPWWEEE